MICPYCNGKRVQRATTAGLNAVRILLDSNKRFCKDCKKRWQSRYSSDFRPGLYRIGLLFLLFAFSLAGLRFADRAGLFTSSSVRSSSGSSHSASSRGEDPNELIREQAIRAGKMQRRAAYLARQEQRHR